MNVDGLGNLVAHTKRIELGLQRPDVEIPNYRTVQPRLLAKTKYIGALDGSDQQMYALPGIAELGVAVWATLFLEFDVRRPDKEIHRSGPNSSGPWTKRDLVNYRISIELHNEQVNQKFRNDYYSWRQILSHARPTEPPIFKTTGERQIKGVRQQAAIERATGEWLAWQAAITRHLPPGSLMLRDGRFNCQIEQSASWVDQIGRRAVRNQIRAVAVVKSGLLYGQLFPIVREIATNRTKQPFYFIIPKNIIEDSYGKNEKNPIRKTLMVGGKDHTDLAGIGALWTAFCPNPDDFKSFVILEFNLYDLYNYKTPIIDREPIDLRTWHIEKLEEATHDTLKGTKHIWVTDLKINETRDIEDLVEPTIQEILELCEREVGHFGYPNLLGKAHREIVLTNQKMKLLREQYKELFAYSNKITEELEGNDFVDNPHKSHHI
ncbi:hypothetical protein [Nostoc sp.]|uniref:hypothetical protein n=1 Tax=Nostoc sp. TaxID=1180 RepID=UPI002FF9C94A